MEPAFQALQAWMAASGEEPAAAARERYLTNRDDGVDPSAYRTEIVWPLR
jgi:effector-binding domain-containing protein